MSANDILVLAEVHQGAPAPITFELLGGARQAANDTSGEVIAVLSGHEIKEIASTLRAADRILVIDDPRLAGFSPEPYLAVLEHVVKTETPRVVLLGSTSVGLDLASHLAARLETACINGCCAIKANEGQLEIDCQMFAGKMMSNVSVDKTPAILTVMPGRFHKSETDGKAQVEDIPCPVSLEGGAITFNEMILPDAGDIDITQSDVLIAVGRGIQGEENLEVAEELANALGGVLCASRPVVDQSWLPTTRQVGKSGMTVKPKLYIALGVSGAPEHIEGMKDSGLIIAINTDTNAPIFDTADYGVVADLLDVVPSLTEALSEKASV